MVIRQPILFAKRQPARANELHDRATVVDVLPAPVAIGTIMIATTSADTKRTRVNRETTDDD